MSQAVVHGSTVYLAGQVGMKNRDGSIDAQTREIFESIDSWLAEAGTDRTQLLSATIWLAKQSDFGAFNALWAVWLADAPKPVRATVCGAQLALSGLDIEIMVVAALPGPA
jgi:enamine deaminase RidA (YjgF/YER057c/UK114 family)